MEIAAQNLGTVALDGMWAPYIDMVDADFLPTRITVGKDEYGYHSSMIIFGHGAVLPERIRELRAQGKKVVLVEREERYYVFVSPPG